MEDGDLLSSVTPRLDGRPFRWTVGTRAVSASQWLSIDEQRHRLMAAKDRVLDADTDGSVITTATISIYASMAHVPELSEEEVREMLKDKFSEWLDFLNAVAADRGVILEPVAA